MCWWSHAAVEYGKSVFFYASSQGAKADREGRNQTEMFGLKTKEVELWNNKLWILLMKTYSEYGF